MEEEIKFKEDVRFKDYLIQFSGTRIGCDYVVYEEVAWDDNEGNNPQYHRKNDISMDFTSDLQEAQQILKGFIKWDGCMQFTVEEGMHFDTMARLKDFCEVLTFIRTKSAELQGRDEDYI